MTGDSLLNLLEKKGLISDSEAQVVRQEATQSFATNFQSNFRSQTGLSSWVNTLKFNGDFRGRFEQNSAANAEYFTRDRYRYRVRFGVTAALQDNFEVGLRLSSGNPQTNPGGTLVGGQSITANTDMGSLESRKFIWIDLAYAKWTPIQNSNWTVSGTFRKNGQPVPALQHGLGLRHRPRRRGRCNSPIVPTPSKPSKPMGLLLCWTRLTRRRPPPG